MAIQPNTARHMRADDQTLLEPSATKHQQKTNEPCDIRCTTYAASYVVHQLHTQETLLFSKKLILYYTAIACTFMSLSCLHKTVNSKSKLPLMD